MMSAWKTGFVGDGDGVAEPDAVGGVAGGADSPESSPPRPHPVAASATVSRTPRKVALEIGPLPGIFAAYAGRGAFASRYRFATVRLRARPPDRGGVEHQATAGHVVR
ncbi:hypothetical protein GCM10009736_29650 [Actinomadura bangladeshensis]